MLCRFSIHVFSLEICASFGQDYCAFSSWLLHVYYPFAIFPVSSILWMQFLWCEFPKTMHLCSCLLMEVGSVSVFKIVAIYCLLAYRKGIKVTSFLLFVSFLKFCWAYSVKDWSLLSEFSRVIWLMMWMISLVDSSPWCLVLLNLKHCRVRNDCFICTVYHRHNHMHHHIVPVSMHDMCDGLIN